MGAGLGLASEEGLGGETESPSSFEGHGGLLSRYCPGNGVCSRMDQAGEVERPSGDKGSSMACQSHPLFNGPRVEDEGEMTLRVGSTSLTSF